MIDSFKNESYKFSHQKTPVYGLIALIMVMLYSAIVAKITKNTLIIGFGAIEWLPIILIATGSTFFSMEYSNNTIMLLMYKGSKKFEIYIAKFLVIFLYGLWLTSFAVVTTFLLKFILVNNKYSWLAIDQGRPLVTNLLLNMLGSVIYSFFIVAFSFMLIMLVKNNAIVICSDLVIGFLGASVSTALLKLFPVAVNVLKWNSLNMIFISQQLARGAYTQISKLTNQQLVLGTFGYGVIFLLLGYLLFKHQKV
ncbi:ABC transporter permease [Lactobacillus sp. ESL0681]|uniref:ABC transporter permease n=1 Tax=Lactobacillus sp. ESL0681 TaxID=2983211 RepID=UPI0023F6FDA6|nr:ABC transporter permease [Lactobacillus sp. ESL0681]WEV39696.1 ABC transporter permease [Lactobacillus sp. ESL0681]